MTQLQETRCKICQTQILPREEQNLQTIRGLNIIIHSEHYYILEIKCNFCGYDNFIYREGGLDKKTKDAIMKKIS